MARHVRIATVALLDRGGPTVEANRERIAALIEQAAAEKPDIICLPETFLEQGVSFTDLAQVAEPIPGPTIDMVAGYAKKYGCYIICPLTAIHGDKYMNDSVLLDRRGQVVGIYSKIHPVVEGSEFRSLEKGMTPGTEARVFDTDFGRVGMQICFDIFWPETWQELKCNGAEIVFWSSAYDGGKHLSIHAWNNHFYVVSAVKSRRARIVDVMGEVLGVTGWADPVIARTVNLDVEVFHCDFNRSQIPLIRAKYGPDVKIRLWHEEDLFTLEAEREGLTVEEIIREFSLEPLHEYLDRNARLQDAWRRGRAIPDLTPPYVGRPQWE